MLSRLLHIFARRKPLPLGPRHRGDLETSMWPADWVDVHGLAAPDGTFVVDRVGALGERDLGPAWTGTIQDMPAQYQAFAHFVMGWLAMDPASWRDFQENVEALVRTGASAAEVKEVLGPWTREDAAWLRSAAICQGRAATAAMAWLEAAQRQSRERRGGEGLSPADYLWLRRLDRPLYYGLTALAGSQRGAVLAEGFLVYTHYELERALKTPLAAFDAGHAVTILQDVMPAPDEGRAPRP